MIIYFDTSAFVPLLIAEPASELCRRLWNDSDAVVTSRLLYVEAAAALAQAVRLSRLAEERRTAAMSLLDTMWREFDVIELDSVLMTHAGALAHQCGLRGYDAMHVAAADLVQDTDLVVASGDKKVLGACCALGMATADVNDVSAVVR
jgi:predicted nucleic acid-binding protein